MANLTSPGLAINEYDFTAIIPSESSVTGAICGTFFSGPIGVPVLVASEAELVAIFGKPTDLNYQTFFTAANFLQYSNSLYVVRADSNTNFNATTSNLNMKILNQDDYSINYFGGTTGNTALTKFAAQYSGTKGNSLALAICSDKNRYDTSIISGVNLTASCNVGSNTLTFSANVEPYISTGSSQNLYISTLGPISNVVSVSNTTVVVGADQIAAITANNSNASARAKWIYSTAFETPLGTSPYVALNGGSNDEMHIVVIDTLGKITGSIGGIVERYPNVSKAADAKSDDGSTNYYVEVLKQKSQNIWVINHPESNWGTLSTGTTYKSNTSQYLTFSGGNSGIPTDADVFTGYDLFADKENISINLLMSGDGDGGSSAVVAKVMSIADTRKDCLACISPTTLTMCTPSSTLLSTAIVQQLAVFKASLSPLTSYTVMDSAWKYQFDKYLNKYRYVPLNGDIAGLIARTSSNQDAWWSPAGLSRGKIQNAIKLSWNPNQTQRDELYKISINPVIAIPNEGIVLYGDKTLLNSTSAFSRINVRSLFILLEKSISKAAKYSLFEFNDEFTRSQFVALVEPFLRNIKAKRGIYDYKVVCDTTNNTPDVIDSNKFIGSIFVKPARSINFIELNFVAVGTAIDFTIITNNAGI
jgi:hypothetical protein